MLLSLLTFLIFSRFNPFCQWYPLALFLLYPTSSLTSHLSSLFPYLLIILSCFLSFYPIFHSSSHYPSFLSYPLPHRFLPFRHFLLLLPSCFLFSVLSLPHPHVLLSFLFYFFIILYCSLSFFSVLRYPLLFLSISVLILSVLSFSHHHTSRPFVSFNIPHRFMLSFLSDISPSSSHHVSFFLLYLYLILSYFFPFCSISLSSFFLAPFLSLLPFVILQFFFPFLSSIIFPHPFCHLFPILSRPLLSFL